MQTCRYPTSYVEITNGSTTDYCWTDGTAIDCYPSTTLLATTSGRFGSVVSPNYVGGKIDCSSTTKKGSNMEADINIKLTYPQ